MQWKLFFLCFVERLIVDISVNYAYVTSAVHKMDYSQLSWMFSGNGYAHVDTLIIQLWV